jgi:hypothetical protein
MSKGKWEKQRECAMYIQSVFVSIMNVWMGEWYQLYNNNNNRNECRC